MTFLEQSIDALKFREAELCRLANDTRIRLEEITKVRSSLETFRFNEEKQLEKDKQS